MKEIKFVGLQFVNKIIEPIEPETETIIQKECLVEVHATVEEVNGLESSIVRNFPLNNLSFSSLMSSVITGKDNAAEYQSDFFELMKAKINSEYSV